jgi:hypothetical protein
LKLLNSPLKLFKVSEKPQENHLKMSDLKKTDKDWKRQPKKMNFLKIPWMMEEMVRIRKGRTSRSFHQMRQIWLISLWMASSHLEITQQKVLLTTQTSLIMNGRSHHRTEITMKE